MNRLFLVSSRPPPTALFQVGCHSGQPQNFFGIKRWSCIWLRDIFSNFDQPTGLPCCRAAFLAKASSFFLVFSKTRALILEAVIRWQSQLSFSYFHNQSRSSQKSMNLNFFSCRSIGWLFVSVLPKVEKNHEQKYQIVKSKWGKGYYCTQNMIFQDFEEKTFIKSRQTIAINKDLNLRQ